MGVNDRIHFHDDWNFFLAIMRSQKLNIYHYSEKCIPLQCFTWSLCTWSSPYTIILSGGKSMSWRGAYQMTELLLLHDKWQQRRVYVVTQRTCTNHYFHTQLKNNKHSQYRKADKNAILNVTSWWIGSTSNTIHFLTFYL